MQRGRSQHSRTLQAKLKNVIEKSKPNQSKGKNFIDINHLATTQSYSKNISANTSPSLVKQSDNDKQNLDVLETVIKIVSAAADAKQKQILLSLASHVQKQKKIRNYLTQKQSNSQKTQLQAMLAHLRQEELKDISSLKIQIGKRKLQNLDQHDLNEDILNLNSYVMRRSKKESSVLKTQGIDLIGEIYNKFDEQSKFISQVIGGEKTGKLNNIKEKHMSEDLGMIQSTLANFKTIQSYGGKDQKQRISTGKVSEISQNSSSSELMHKILRLEKQNLRLMKEIGKIQEEFECVVEEKLLLQQKIERVKANLRHSKKKMSKCFNQLKTQFNEQRDLHENCKREIIEILKTQKKSFSQQFTFISEKLYDISTASEKTNSISASPEHQNSSPFCEQKQISDHLKSSIESESSVLERYEALLTEKQLQINKLLRSLSKIKEQNQIIAGLLNIEKQKSQYNQREKQTTQGKLKSLTSQIGNLRDMVRQSEKIVRDEISKFKTQNIQITEMLNHRFFNMVEELNCLSSKSERLASQLLNKDSQLLQCIQKIKQIESESKKWQQKYEQSANQNEKQKERLAQQITKIENILKSQQQKANESLNLMKNSIESLSQQNNKKLDGKQAYIEEIQKEKQRQHLQATQMRKQIQFLKQQINKLVEQKDQFINLKRQWEIRQEQLIKNIQDLQKTQINPQCYIEKSKHSEIIKEMEEQFLNKQSSMIEECGMLLQGKNEEIGVVFLQVQRQKIIKQDLLSFIDRRQKQIQADKKKLKKLLNLITKYLRQLKIQAKQTILPQNLAEQFRAFQCFFLVQFQEKIAGLVKNRINRKLSYQHQVTFFQNIPLPSLTIQEKEVNQILKLFPNYDQSNQNLPKNKFENLKNLVLSLLQELNKKKRQLSLMEIEKGQNIEMNKQQSDKYELNDYEALSPEEEQGGVKSENSSFLCQLQPFKFENLLGEQSFSLTEVINQSAIVDEVCALRNELAESFKRNQYYQRELKIYQQKDIDKIFDF